MSEPIDFRFDFSVGAGRGLDADALREETEATIARGVLGSPFVVVDGEPLWGHDQAERRLESGGR